MDEGGPRRRADPGALEDEQQRHRGADRNRQVGDADRKERELGDDLVHGQHHELDGNPIIGNWRDRHPNVHVVAGFSGHGLMHAPAAGRGIAELIVHGRFRSLDLTRLGYDRVPRGEPYPELGIL